MKSNGILPRFSAQSVSITPAALWSCTSTKPRSFQNDCSCGHSCSGVSDVRSQRSLPRRSSLTSPSDCGATTAGCAAPTAAAGAPAWYAAALTEPLCAC